MLFWLVAPETNIDTGAEPDGEKFSCPPWPDPEGVKVTDAWQEELASSVAGQLFLSEKSPPNIFMLPMATEPEVGFRRVMVCGLLDVPIS